MSEREALKPCPFCDKAVDLGDPDTLYPTMAWRKDDDICHYVRIDEPHHGLVWTMHCSEQAGGCGAEISGDSREEAIAAWNRRAALATDALDPRTLEAAAKVCENHDEVRDTEGVYHAPTQDDCAHAIRALAQTAPADGQATRSERRAELGFKRRPLSHHALPHEDDPTPQADKREDEGREALSAHLVEENRVLRERLSELERRPFIDHLPAYLAAQTAPTEPQADKREAMEIVSNIVRCLDEDCTLEFGKEHVESFRTVLAALSAQPAPGAVDDLIERVEWIRNNWQFGVAEACDDVLTRLRALRAKEK